MSGNVTLTQKLARIIVLMQLMQRHKDRKRLVREPSEDMNAQYNAWGSELTKLNHDHDVIAAIAKASAPEPVELGAEEDETPIWGECLYCGEAVELPAKYCCEEHEEGRRIE